MNIRGDPDSEFKREIKKQIREAIKQNTDFKKKLNERGIEGKYIRNVTQHIMNSDCPNSKLRNIVCIITSKSKPSSIIFTTLYWNSTKEGDTYWNDIYESFSINKRLD